MLDSSGATIPEATVKVTNAATQLIRTVTTGADGTYAVPDLPVGPYRIDVTKEGFASFAQTGIVLQVATNPTSGVTKVGTEEDISEIQERAIVLRHLS